MARTNLRQPRRYSFTHQGAPAANINPVQELKRTVLANMLWEDTFYEDGQDINDRLKELIPKVSVDVVADIAIEGRNVMKIRHTPLMLLAYLAQNAQSTKDKNLIRDIIPKIIQRADEPAELLAMYWKDGKRPVFHKLRQGIADSLFKFDKYQLAKWKGSQNQISLSDVIRITHPAAKTKAANTLLGLARYGKLKPPDTWEVILSAKDGKSKKEKWERLLGEDRLGAMALLRNLRNMKEAGVDSAMVKETLKEMNSKWVLPYRFVAAARAVPEWEQFLDEPFIKCADNKPKIPGKTIVLIDVSYSMSDKLSSRSDLSRQDAANALAAICRELCEEIYIFSFSHHTIQIPARHGFALMDAINASQRHGGTYLGQAVKDAEREHSNYDRLIVFTDEQSHDTVPQPRGKGYMINVASYERGVGYGKWLNITGWSEHVLDYIREYESFLQETKRTG